MSLGKVLVFSAPSGAGKTTIVKHLVQKYPSLSFSVSATTRAKRIGEIEGKDYYFLEVEEFKRKIKNKEFIEYEQVYDNLYYGTLKSEVDRLNQEKKCVVLDVDVQGGINIKRYFGENAFTVFVQPPTIEALRLRLEERNTESAEAINQRIAKAKSELTFASEFDEILYNDRLDDTLIKAEQLVRTFIEK